MDKSIFRNFFNDGALTVWKVWIWR